jgi:hypothetical protein
VHTYRLNGIRVAAEMELVTLVACGDAAPPDIELRFSPGIGDAAREALYSYTRPDAAPFLDVAHGADGYLVRVHRVADFLVTQGSIACAPLSSCPPATLEQFLVDQIIPRAMQLIGRPCFHASAAAIDGVGAVAFIGASGAGKSTLCAAFAERGAIIGDDSLALTPTSDAVLALPGYPSLRVWPRSAAALLGEGVQLELASPRTTKLRVPRTIAKDPVPLVHMFVLEPKAGASPTLERFGSVDAFTILSRSLFRLAPRDANVMAAEFELLTEVSARVPVSRLTFAHDFAQTAAVIDTIVEQLRR